MEEYIQLAHYFNFLTSDQNNRIFAGWCAVMCVEEQECGVSQSVSMIE